MGTSKKLLLILGAAIVCLSCLPQRAVESEEQRPVAPRPRTGEQGSNPDLETATFALG